MSMNKRNPKWENRAVGVLLLAGFGYILTRACIEFYAIAWGSGVWLGEFSLKWGVVFFAFILFCIFSWGAATLVFWKRNIFIGWLDRIISIRNKLGIARWLVILVLLLFRVMDKNLRFHQLHILSIWPADYLSWQSRLGPCPRLAPWPRGN